MNVKLARGRATAGAPTGALDAVFVAIPDTDATVSARTWLDGISPSMPSTTNEGLYAFSLGQYDGTSPIPNMFDPADINAHVYLISPGTWKRLRAERFS